MLAGVLPLLTAIFLFATTVVADGRFIVFYTDAPPGALPSVSDLQGFNTVYLGFWGRGGAHSGNPIYTYQGLSASDRATRKADFASAGILQMISAFGEGFTLTGAEDPTETATELATWVTTYGVDGVDIDFEDITSTTTWGQKAEWMITFQQTLRSLLPASTYYISHSPLPTFFAGSASEQFYSKVDAAAGSGISWYNMQYYNQNAVYSTCPSLLTVAATDSIYAGTSVQELSRSTASSSGIPLAKIQITKPAHPSDTNAGGYLTPDTMASCIREARGFGWTGGVTLFKYGPDADLQTYIAAVRSAYGSPKRNVAIEAPPLVSPAAIPPAARPISPPLGAAVAPLSSTSTVIGDSVKNPVVAPAPAPAPQHTSRVPRPSTSSTRLGSTGADLKSSNDNSDAEYDDSRASADDDDEPRHQSKGGHYASSSSCDNGDEDDADDYRGGRNRGGGRRDLSSGLAFEGLGGMGGRMVMVRRGRDYRLAVEQERRGRHGGSKGGRCG